MPDDEVSPQHHELAEEAARQTEEAARQTEEASRQTTEADRQAGEGTRQTISDEAAVQRAILDEAAAKQRQEIRNVAREAAREVVDQAVIAATKLDETQGGLTAKITDLVSKISVRKRHVVILYTLSVVALLNAAVLWWSVNEVQDVRCEALNDSNARQVLLWEETFLDIPVPDTPEAMARLQRFEKRIHQTFPQEKCG